jgi:transcriptional regulator with XRE-family HTH domain
MAEFNHLGLYLKNKRTEKKMTQAQVALALKDVHVQFVSNWERGLCAPPSHSFQRLIEVLRLDRDKLVSVMLDDAKTEIEAKVFKKKLKKKSI